MAGQLRGLDRSHRGPPRGPFASRLHGHPRRPARPGARHAGKRRRDRKDRGHGLASQRLRHAARARPQHAGADGAHRDGRGRYPVARARRLDGFVLDLRRRWRRAGTTQCRPDAGRIRFRSIGAGTAIYGVLGQPVSHSVSPAMHNAAFRAAHRDAVYLPLAAADFDDFTTFAEAVGLRGASVTAPFKVNAFERADECDPVSRRIQAVNTLRRDGVRWLGCNTDVSGFLAPLEASMHLRGARATILGAGGAARSVSVALTSAGMRVTIAARRQDQAQAVAALTGAAVGPWPPDPGLVGPARQCDAGRHRATQRRIAAPGGYRSTAAIVYDLVYNPPQTKLLAGAAEAGCRTIGGSTCSSRRRRRSSNGGPDSGWTRDARRPARLHQAAKAAVLVREARRASGRRRERRGQTLKLTTFEEFVDLAKRATFVPVEGAGRRPADAGVGLPQGRRAFRLRVPPRKRRGRRARRPLFVPRQGSIPDSARPQRADSHGEGRCHH